MTKRNEYKLGNTVNKRLLRRVIIDQHYKEKHADINDQIILDLVKELDGKEFNIQTVRGDFEYFAVEPVFKNEKPYRLVLVICIWDDYLGVVNAFRVKEES